MIRVLHFSDIHLAVPLSHIPLASFMGKRMLGAANLLLRRARTFRNARKKLEALAEFARSRKVDLALFTGDCTALGTEPEYFVARSAMEGFISAPLGLVAVPGNHDLYLGDSVEQGYFERHFGDLLKSDLPEYAVDGKWPLVRLVSDFMAVVAVNSAKPNPEPWLSNGRVSDSQLRSLTEILSDERIRGRFVFVVTHFAARRADGRPHRYLHGFANGEEFLRICSRIRSGAVLNGHIHSRYHLRVQGFSLPIFNAGSATYEGREGFWLFELGNGEGRALPGFWDGARYQVDEQAAVPVTVR